MQGSDLLVLFLPLLPPHDAPDDPAARADDDREANTRRDLDTFQRWMDLNA